MSSDLAIKVEGVSKCFHMYENPQDRLKQMIIPQFRKLFGLSEKRYFKEFWALRDINFEVGKGETVGVIGRNGSGKSTLLQIICGTLTPTTGQVQTFGRIGALLELGSGFNPDFTGRDNVYLNGAVLGLSREEVDQRFDAIASFADIGDFLDQPVKMYSSGMAVRLAFAVQAQVEPDILIVDEALAVGDAKFQAKCFERLRQLKENGTSILLVTHSGEQIVSHCSSALLLNEGIQLGSGTPKVLVNQYLELLFGSNNVNSADISDDQNSKILVPESKLDKNLNPDFSGLNGIFEERAGYNEHEFRWGDKSAEIVDYKLSINSINYPVIINSGDKVNLKFLVKFHNNVKLPIYGVALKTKDGVMICTTNSELREIEAVERMRGDIVMISSEFELPLSGGDYFLSLGVASKLNGEVVPHDRRYDSIHLQISPEKKFIGVVDLKMNIKINAG